MIQVVPAIIPKTFDDLKRQIKIVKPFVGQVQVDVMDGVYAPEASWPYNVEHTGYFDYIKIGEEKVPYSEEINIELDMMVEKPEDHIDEWMKSGVKTFIIHFGSTNKLQEIIDRIKENNLHVALALRPETSNSELEPFIPQVDFVQFMGNQKIGYHGVTLDEAVLGKIRDLRNLHSGLIISIDIGVNFETAPKLIKAGVSKLVSGSTIFNSENIEEAIKKLAQTI